MGLPAAFLCAAVALAPAGCGRAEAPAAPGTPLDVVASRFSWIPSGEGERLPYVEEVVGDAAAWHEVWARRPDAREPAPAVDFGSHRVVVVAQHALHAGYGGVSFSGARREGDALVVDYVAHVPVPGSVHAQVYKGYQGFYLVVPREPARISVRRRSPS
jgi:hypothetical protein